METLIWLTFLQLAMMIVFCGIMIYALNRSIKLLENKRNQTADLYKEELREIDEFLEYPTVSLDNRIELTLRKYEIERRLINYQKSFKKTKADSSDEK